MILMNLLLACIFALCVVAAPTDFELHSPVAIPVPGSATYDADVAAILAYVRSHNSSPVQRSAADEPITRLCGFYESTPDSKPLWKEMREDGSMNYRSFELDPGSTIKSVLNRHCGFCMYFDEKGALIMSVGPDEVKFAHPTTAKTYICWRPPLKGHEGGN
ncbi:hypothetical protein J4E93_002849 [Alternaria ventricosa]|uniref:uncharacterized protein n=1 Tax=Alternaria ventricosa TaxID=1187951 RepID=UPI0020C4D479|nr:uncharacterized protein J4E93_002849 [Alternaria ventricosa]KAI4650493.1 hypothetical protein J4E93_002849 [Alternaria ventricosa]